MSNQVVLNHHSLPFVNRASADKGIIFFLQVLKACQNYGLKILLLETDQDKSLMRIQLTDGYFISDWFNQAKRDAQLIEWSRFLRLLETQQPLFDQVAIEIMDDAIEVGLNGESSSSIMLAAYWYKTFLASFTAFEKWLQPLIPIWILDLRHDEEVVSGHQLCNLANDDCLKHHKFLLENVRNSLIKDANDIWNNRAVLFPNLTLLSNQIGTALKTWSHRHDVLIKARDALYILELFSSNWKKHQYVDYRHAILRSLGLAADVSGESASIRNDAKKRNERMFWLDDGRQVYCENQVKLADGYRLHFYPDQNTRHIYVAYLGPHMSI